MKYSIGAEGRRLERLRTLRLPRLHRVVGFAGLGLVTTLGGFGLPAANASAPPVNLPSRVSQVPASNTPNVVIGSFPEDVTTQIWAYAPIGGVMYACGDFAQVKSPDNYSTYERENVFAFDPATGAVSSFASNVNGPVYSCTATQDGNGLYIGGDFSAVNGRPADNIAEIDIATGRLVRAFTAGTNRQVTDVQLVGDRLLVSGNFSTISGASRPAFAAVNPATGSFDPYLALDIAGQVAGPSGFTSVDRFTIGPAERQGVAIGNFTTVDGISHEQAFRFKLGETPSLVAWDNPMFHQGCGARTPVWSRDVQFAPNGRFFVIAGSGGPGTGLCDTATRWETAARGDDVQPTWINHTCTDTLHSVAVTQRVVYVQGHQKCVMGKQGQEVPRVGIAALSASTGWALHWRSDQSRRTGGKFLMVTNPTANPGLPAGLWAGCDCGPEGGIIFRPLQ